VTLKQIKVKAAQLKRSRALSDVDEAELRELISAFLGHGDAKAFAEDLGVTPQYLSDIRHGRRGFSEEFLKKLATSGGKS
jgi:transcriptional regulator with XRE-family HTH domain